MMVMIREKAHRLPKEFYLGSSIVAFTLCVKERAAIFQDSELVNTFIRLLGEIVKKYKCKIPVYCFMPDHVHLIITGIDEKVDLLKVVSLFKQKTGFWMAKNRLGAYWQKDFFDHVIKKDESISTNIKYILDNPVRKGIITDWQG